MKVRKILSIFSLLASLFSAPGLIYPQELKSIQLLPPRTEGGKPLMQALKERKSGRQFSNKEIPLQVLSDMLWAAYGINRPDTGGRTVPSPMDVREMEIYVAKAEGLYLYDPSANTLLAIVAKDLRGLVGTQSYVKEAPINLIYVADYSRMGRLAGSEDFYSAVDVGFISQNVYLYCASEGLSTVVRAWVDRKTLAKEMKLRPQQNIILAQSIGYPVPQ